MNLQQIQSELEETANSVEEIFTDEAKGKITLCPPSGSEFDRLVTEVSQVVDDDSDEIDILTNVDTTGHYHSPVVIVIHWPTAQS